MYHEYPYKAQIPILIDGEYEYRTFTSNNEVWDVINLLIAETKEEIERGRDLNIAESVIAQLPFFACKDILIDNQVSKDISRFLYCRQNNTPPYTGGYGNQPKKWVEKSFMLDYLMERQKSKAQKNGR